jgi:NADH-quinone oxidoreductase subunit J
MEIVVQILFMLISALIIIAALMVVSVKNIIHAALWLFTSFFAVGALYLLLEAEFVAVIQVLVYVGAVSILVLFAIMLTRHVTGEGQNQLYSRWWLGLIVALTLFGAIIVPTVFKQKWNVAAPTAVMKPQNEESVVKNVEPVVTGVADIGKAFMREYLLPFEVASLVLLVALIGAIVVVFEERTERRVILTLAESWALRQKEIAKVDQ